MITPTIEELTNNGKFNRYELSIAVAKCARLITAEYSKQREAAEKTINKESDKTVYSIVNADLCDKKSVKLAIEDIYDGKYTILKPQEAEEYYAAEAEKARAAAEAAANAEEAKAEEALDGEDEDADDEEEPDNSELIEALTAPEDTEDIEDAEDIEDNEETEE